jgi:hypothetical protein
VLERDIYVHAWLPLVFSWVRDIYVHAWLPLVFSWVRIFGTMHIYTCE